MRRKGELPLSMPLTFPAAPPYPIRTDRGEWTREETGAPPYADLSASLLAAGGYRKSAAVLVREDTAPVDRRVYWGLVLLSPRVELELRRGEEGRRECAVAVTLSLRERLEDGAERTLAAAAQTLEPGKEELRQVLEWGSPLLEWEAEGTAGALVLALEADASDLEEGASLQARCTLGETVGFILPRP
ncbi:MAG: hypothetical protein DRP90_07505 [Planctomycetota bacterium]|nr:MAG: hypothetical protein DRP90_07505 [Planctomycetota bacterium]